MKLSLLLSPLLAALASAATITGSIGGGGGALVPADTAVTLTTAGAAHRALVRRDGSFVLRGVGAGSYVLEGECRTRAFAPLRVDVARDGAVAVFGTFRGGQWSNRGERRGLPIVSGQPAGAGAGRRLTRVCRSSCS